MQNDRNEFEEQILLDLSTGKLSLDAATSALCYQDASDTLRRLAQADLVMPEQEAATMNAETARSFERMKPAIQADNDSIV